MGKYKKTIITCIIFLLIILFIFTSCTKDNRTETNEKISITVSAAASLTDVLQEVKEQFEATYPIEVSYNFAGSGTLAQQIERGAPVDLFISADEMHLQSLIEKQLLDETTKVDVTYNQLVLITGKNASAKITSIDQLSPDNAGQIAIGNPDTVPAGKYTQQLLSNMEKWDVLVNQFIFTKDVRQVLTYVETENVNVGFVYETDAIQSKLVNVIDSADPSLHDVIAYPAAVTVQSNHEQAAIQFIDYLLSDEAQSIFSAYGFTDKNGTK